MALPRNYYTIEEALGLLKRRFPSDPPDQALPELLHRWGAPTWIIDRETGRRIDVPSEMFFKADYEAQVNLLIVRPGARKDRGGSEGFIWRGGNEAGISARRAGFSEGTWHFGELRVDKETLDHALGQDDEGAEATAVTGNYAQASKPPNKLGRPKGSGSFSDVDQPLIEKMRIMIKEQPELSVWGAAGLVVEQAKGSGTFESKQTRLMRRYKSTLSEIERN